MKEKKTGLSSGYWMRMWILIALGNKELHGYELINQISQLIPGLIREGIGGMGRGYRILKELELEGLVTSHWSLNEKGPARKIYRLTPEGEKVRRESIKHIKEIKTYIERICDLIEEN